MDQHQIVINRKKSIKGMALTFEVRLDGNLVGTLPNGGTVSFYAAEGLHTMSFSAPAISDVYKQISVPSGSGSLLFNAEATPTGIDIKQAGIPRPEMQKKKHPILKAVLGIFLALIVIGVIGNMLNNGNQSTSSSRPTSTPAAATMEPQKATVNDPYSDGVIDVDISKCHVKYLRHEIVENMAGEKCVAVYYEFTNNSDKEKAFYVTVGDKAFQNGVELDTSLFHVSDESKDSSAEIKPGVTVTVCSGFKLRDTTSDIELEVSEWISFKSDPADKMVLSISG